MNGDEAEPQIPAWVSKLGIVDRASGIEKARSSRQQLVDVAEAAMAAFRQAGGITTPNLVLLGLVTRGPGLHDASIDALENDNPFAAFTLIRAYAENAAAAQYAIEQPEKIDKLIGMQGARIPLSTITNHAMQSPSTRFGEFKAVYRELSSYAHPASTSILVSAKSVGENGFQWALTPTFKAENDFLTASAWIVEFAEANAKLLAEFAAHQGDDDEIIVYFG